MTVICPKGHASTTSDYCDQCGTPLDVAPPAAGAVQPTEILPPVDDLDTAAAAPADSCPVCETPRSGGDRYCEECGYDFVAGTPRVAVASAHRTGEGEAASEAAAGWEAVVTADKQRLERYADAALAFPAQCPELRVELDQAEVQIGRSGLGSGIASVDIDLVGPFEDPAVSRLHAVFVRQADGSYAVVDLDSTNGTMLNDDVKPIDARVPVPLVDGDRVSLGAWTTVTLRRL